MNTIAKMIGISFVVVVAGAFGAMLTAGVFYALGLEAGFFPYLVAGVWSGEFLNSVIWK